MIHAGIPDKYSFHMQVSARPIGSFFDADRLVLKLPTRLAFGTVYQSVTLRIRASATTVICCVDVASMHAFTKALRSTTFITEHDIGTPIRRHRRRLCPHIQTVFAAERWIDHGSGARRLSPRHEGTISRPAFSHREKEHHMKFDSQFTRRGFAATVATGVASIGLLATTAQSAEAYQGNMERALASLHQALQSLQEATANKGGHRARAVELVRQAIEETQAGVAFADEHGGGGR
jgi:hypothetical protein